MQKAIKKNRLLLSQCRGRLSSDEISSFRHVLFAYHSAHRRDLPWRNTEDPYCILVSEFMLQQTQVERVMTKYGPFIARFPDFTALARALLRDILDAWQGLGYNRRAMSLWKLAQIVQEEHDGKLPTDVNALMHLPGIGAATAGSIAAFAFHKPSVIIETNIRRVFIHHFFQNREGVRDDEILPLVEETLDRSNPREWYYALMDYGSMLKKKVENPNKKSAHYIRQAPFEGSDRKLRGAILRTLLNEKSLTGEAITSIMGYDRERTERILSALTSEGLVKESEGAYFIP